MKSPGLEGFLFSFFFFFKKKREKSARNCDNQFRSCHNLKACNCSSVVLGKVLFVLGTEVLWPWQYSVEMTVEAGDANTHWLGIL